MYIDIIYNDVAFDADIDIDIICMWWIVELNWA